jgi:phosphohistidine swiveling domain-containing protein
VVEGCDVDGRPAVGATDAIRDGEVITVDGAEGTVRRHRARSLPE